MKTSQGWWFLNSFIFITCTRLIRKQITDMIDKISQRASITKDWLINQHLACTSYRAENRQYVTSLGLILKILKFIREIAKRCWKMTVHNWDFLFQGQKNQYGHIASFHLFIKTAFTFLSNYNRIYEEPKNCEYQFIATKTYW